MGLDEGGRKRKGFGKIGKLSGKRREEGEDGYSRRTKEGERLPSPPRLAAPSPISPLRLLEPPRRLSERGTEEKEKRGTKGGKISPLSSL